MRVNSLPAHTMRLSHCPLQSERATQKATPICITSRNPNLTLRNQMGITYSMSIYNCLFFDCN